ncbi:MAG: hypothetical protein AAGC57_19790, partial [Pseudomonadota bacterium]
MTARRKQDAVLRGLWGEPLATVSRGLRVTAADLSGGRDAALEAGAARLQSRPRVQDGTIVPEPRARS